MEMEVISKYIKQMLLLFFLLGLCTQAYASATGSVTVPGSIQVGDTVILSINNYTEQVYYGPYSTVDSIAAGLAAKLSSDCSGPANARSASGGIVNIKMRGLGTVNQLTISVAGRTSTATLATISSTIIPNGGSTMISVQASCGSACGGMPVDFLIDGAAWTTATLDANGQFSINTPINWAPGLHNVVADFQGGGAYLGSTSNAVSFTISTSSNPSLPSTTIYGYSIMQPDGATSGYAPNGNILAYNDSVNGQWSNITYDGLNRLTSANYTAPSGTTQYMCWGYDSFGNRTYQTEPTTTPCSSSPPPPLQYDAGNHLAGISYDASGNVTNDGTNQYLYDAEGRVCAIQSSLSGARVAYIYDAEGRRVAKGTISSFSCDLTSNGFTETAGYVLGPNGEQITEMDGSGNWVHTNVFAAGQLIATYVNDQQGVHFHLSDWLGTRHVSTDYAGNPQSSYQNLPFGELIPSNKNLGVTEHFFTGKERDAESGLDYFGARYFGSSMGRMMSPDPGWFFSSRLENPQTWNQYSYVLNNPLSFVDPDGFDCVYLNNAGNGVESVDQNSSQTECSGDGKNNKGSGGFWVDGTATGVTLYTNSNDVGLSGQKDDGTLTSSSYGQHEAVDSQAEWTDSSLAFQGNQPGYTPLKMTFDPYTQRLFGTHWCGSGGAGVPINALDAGCKAHDQCFDAAGISAANNDGGGHMTLQQAAAASKCNAALAGVAAANPKLPGSTRISEWLKHGDQILVITGGRIDGHLAGGTATR